MGEKEIKLRRIKYLVFHRASSEMEEILQKALSGVDLYSLSSEDLDAVLEVVSLYDRDLEEILFRGGSASEKVKRGLRILGLMQ